MKIRCCNSIYVCLIIDDKLLMKISKNGSNNGVRMDNNNKEFVCVDFLISTF